MNQLPDNSTARVFFALWPTAAEQRRLAAWQKPLLHLCKGRTMRADTLHCTLVFIGNIGQSGLEALQLAAQEVSGRAFELRLDEARYWEHNHIVYAAPKLFPPHLVHLAGALEQRLTAHRFEFDRREYKPHVTLLRNASWTNEPLPSLPPVCWQMRDFALMQSVQRGGQASYRVLARFPLG